MGVGIGIALLAIGLVLALAAPDTVGSVDLDLIGWILSGVGGLAIVVALIMTAQRSHQTIEHVNRTETGGGTGAGGSSGGGAAGGG